MVSSASVERVFSLLNHSFDDHQQSTLQDYKEATVRLKGTMRIGGQDMINNFYYFTNVKFIYNVYKV
jgi:hypothetical protein